MSYFPKKKRSGPKSDRSRAMARADKYFSEYIRLRDCPTQCPCCGHFVSFETADAMHYIGRKNLITRYDEQNVWAGCRRCNRFESGNIVQFRMWLIAKIGERAVEEMEVRSQLKGAEMKEWDFNFVAETYKAKCKELAWKKPVD